MKKFWIIILIVILISITSALINVLVGAINGRGTGMGVFFTSEIREQRYIRKDEKIEMGEIKNFDLDFARSDIKVYLTEEKQIRVVEYSTRELEQKEHFQTRKTGESLKLTEGEIPFRFLFFNFNRICYDIYIPREYTGNLTIHSVSSDITIQEDVNYQNLKIELTSGDIKMLGNVVAEEIEMTNISGEIKLGNVKAKHIKIKTVSGDVKMQEVDSEKLVVHSTSGTIDMILAKNEMELKTVSGDIDLEKIEGYGEFKTTSGNIKSQDFKPTGKCNIKSVSGEIIMYLNEESNCEIDTKTVSGNERLPNGRNVMGTGPYHKIEIKTTSGNIYLQQ